jgi:rhodanese-related sulfurtransferase
MTIKQLSATELKNRIQQEEKLFLLDVREPHEFQYAHIANSVLKFMGFSYIQQEQFFFLLNSVF